MDVSKGGSGKSTSEYFTIAMKGVYFWDLIFNLDNEKGGTAMHKISVEISTFASKSTIIS